MKKHDIWKSTHYFTDEDWRSWKDFFEDHCIENDIPEGELDFTDFVYTQNDYFLDDERDNLCEIKPSNGIIAIADLGLWNGRVLGTSKVDFHNVSDCLYSDCDAAHWYVEGNDLKCDAAHHDGTNHYTYRKWKDGVTPYQKESLRCEIAYGDQEKAERMIKRLTTGLGRDIAQVYGW